jgi:serine-type D-Ala-D-Ala carboxypeptidase/endopeptidase
MRFGLPAVLALAVLNPAPVLAAVDDAELKSLLQQRLQGDRTGACLAAAVVEPTRVARAVVCADPEAQRDEADAAWSARPIDAATAFEIGSVSKTLLALLLQQEVEAGRLGLDDTLQQHLPKGVIAPSFEGAPITLRHLLSHRSGLPALAPSWRPADPANPYASIDRKALHAGLASVRLDGPPGEGFTYSNFGAMLLSDVISRSAGQPFAELARERIFEPLNMRSFVGRAPRGIARAQGHASTGQPVPAWEFEPALAGVGGVRASLDDMVFYLQAQMGLIDSPLAASIAASQQSLGLESGPPMAMGWMIAPLNGAQILVHEGGTAGFSSFVGFRADHTRGVVVLSDTALTSLGGLSSVALHLLDQRVPMGAPRIAQAAPPDLIEALVGDYQLEGGLRMSLRRRGDALEIQAEGQPAFVMGYDSAGDFYPLAFDALLNLQGKSAQRRLVWMQGGGAMALTPIETEATPADAQATLSDYLGRYPLLPRFALRVFEREGRLMAQASGQGAFELAAAGKDVFQAAAYGIEIRFMRDELGRVDRLDLLQAGQVLSGTRDD